MEDVLLFLLMPFILQLCRTEPTQVLPGLWFSANAINDDFSPKPISELFSTPTPTTVSPFPSSKSTSPQSPVSFSVTDPIVVLPHSSSPEFKSMSSFLPSLKSNTFSSTTFTTPFSDFSSTPTSFPQNLFSSSGPITPSTMQTPTFIVDSTFSEAPKEETPTVRIVPPSSFPTQLPIRELFSSTKDFSSLNDLSSSVIGSTPSSVSTVGSTGPPNYIVVYQQAPQSQPGVLINPIPTVTTASTPLVSSTSTTSTPTFSSISSTLSSTISTPTSSVTPIVSTPSTVFITPTIGSTSAATLANPCLPASRSTNTLSTASLRATIGPSQRNILSTRAPGLVIRLVAPQGSITNLRINPSGSTTTTTKPQRTRRTKKPKRNTFDFCMNSCKGTNPICTVPVGTTLVDQKTLRDFSSICHMACHNSYRNQAYEMILDGRCSRLRTRIISVGSNKKIRRDELKKGEYNIVNPDSPTLLEVISRK